MKYIWTIFLLIFWVATSHAGVVYDRCLTPIEITDADLERDDFDSNAYPVDSPYGISDDCLCGQAGLSKDNARVSRAICKPEGLPGIFGESPLA